MRAIWGILFILLAVSVAAQVPVFEPSRLKCPVDTLSTPLPYGTGRIMRLHPSIGNAITPELKKEFGFFPAIADSNFEMAQLVCYNDSTYTFILHTSPEGRTERPVPAAQVLAMYQAIEKVRPAPAPPVVKKTIVKPQPPHALTVVVQVLDITGNVLLVPAKVIGFLIASQEHYHNESNVPPPSYDKYYSPTDHYLPPTAE